MSSANELNEEKSSLQDDGTIQQTIIYSEAALQIVTDPFLVGRPLLELSKECSMDFVRSLDRDSLEAPYTALSILRGGRYYRLLEAWNEVEGGGPLNLAEVRAKRKVNDDGSWRCTVWHDEAISAVTEQETIDHLLSCNTLIIGDTVATATTLTEVLRWFIALRESNPPSNIVIFSICGSSVAKRNLFPFYRDTLEPKGVAIQMVVANAGYALNEDNGTDLSLVTEDILPAAKQYIAARIGVDFLKKMKCAIWDWGDRFNSIHSHLEEVTAHFVQFVDDDNVTVPDHIREAVERYRNGVSGVEDRVDEATLNGESAQKDSCIVL